MFKKNLREWKSLYCLTQQTNKLKRTPKRISRMPMWDYSVGLHMIMFIPGFFLFQSIHDDAQVLRMLVMWKPWLVPGLKWSGALMLTEVSEQYGGTVLPHDSMSPRTLVLRALA